MGLGLQVGVNLANDFHDGVRGVDTAERLGPPRLTSSGLAPARSVLFAALASVLVAGLSGLALAAVTTWWLVPIGALAMLALWLYSGGPRPYAELGLGEVMVFLFFGVMATAGSAYVQAETVPAAAWWASVPMGLLAVAILVANNLRDIPTDAVAGKRTLAVRLGDRRTRTLYRVCIVGAFAAIVLGTLVDVLDEGSGLSPWSLLALAAAVAAVGPFQRVGQAEGRDLIPVLVATARLQVVFGALLRARTVDRGGERVSEGDVAFGCARAVVGRARAERAHGACSLAGVAFDADRARARAQRTDSVHVHLDERAQRVLRPRHCEGTGRPVVVACTSGTAAADLFPAVDRSLDGAGPARAPDRRSSARAPRGRCEPDDRPGRAVRTVRAVPRRMRRSQARVPTGRVHELVLESRDVSMGVLAGAGAREPALSGSRSSVPAA